MKGLEPSTFCMASRRSSQLSYIRTEQEYSLAKVLSCARNHAQIIRRAGSLQGEGRLRFPR